MAGEYLDAVIVLNGTNDLARARTAGETVASYYIISGENGGRDVRDAEGHARVIYGILRSYGIRPCEMILETASRNTLENILNSIGKLEEKRIPAEHVGFVTSHSQLNRVRLIVDKAKQEGIIDKDLWVTEIPSEETFKEKVYGILAYAREKYKLRDGIGKALQKRPGILTNLIKRLIG